MLSVDMEDEESAIQLLKEIYKSVGHHAWVVGWKMEN